MAVGRPRKQLSDLPEDWKKIVEKEMGEGASKEEICAELKINRELFYKLIKREPEFADTIKKGVELSEAWWKKQGRISLRDKQFSAVLWYMNMKNRFGWADKSEVQHSGKVVVLDI